MTIADDWNTELQFIDNDYAEGVYTGMYFYLMDKESLPVLGNCNAVNSLWFSPILSEVNLQTYDVTYDTERWGKLQGVSINGAPTLKRIIAVVDANKSLGSYRKYIRETPPDDRRDWRNESRLYDYPYSYAMLCDYINAPIEIQYHLINNAENKIDIGAKGFVSDKGIYSLYVENYKGDIWGSLEGAINSAPLDMPVSSSAYSQYSSTQKAQTQFNTQSQIMNSKMGVAQGTIGALGSISLLNPLSALTGGLGIGMNMYRGQVEQAQAIGQKNAMEKDLLNTPRTMLNTSSDIGFSLLNGQAKIELVRYRITDEYLRRLGDYFALYGYKQNKMMVVNYRNRYYYNYVKTIGANVVPKKRCGIPKEHLNEIIQNFDNGMTFWHVHRKGVEMFDYSKDNREY